MQDIFDLHYLETFARVLRLFDQMLKSLFFEMFFILKVIFIN